MDELARKNFNDLPQYVLRKFDSIIVSETEDVLLSWPAGRHSYWLSLARILRIPGKRRHKMPWHENVSYH